MESVKLHLKFYTLSIKYILVKYYNFIKLKIV